MATISACLIVKNEEQVLERCLQCLQPIVDEIIIVDTGSDDGTKEIAKRYTNKVYDFVWVNDFSAARNFSFEKATMEYIYVADADEVIDSENQTKFQQLKAALLPEVEIVQMLYTNQLLHNTTYNYDTEYRPKLYKRVRTFQWVDPLHEYVALEPVIYDSDIKIIHKPLSNHAKRDFHIFQNTIKRSGRLSKKLNSMYARELFIAGTDDDFIEAKEYFEELIENESDIAELKKFQCVLGKIYLCMHDYHQFFKVVLKNVAIKESSAEVCYLLGEYYFLANEYKEASLWYYNAAFETSADLNIHYAGDYPLKRLAECYGMLGNEEEAKKYEALATQWKVKE